MKMRVSNLFFYLVIVYQVVNGSANKPPNFSKHTIGCPHTVGCKCKYDSRSESGFMADCDSLNLSSIPEEFGERKHWTRVDLRFNLIKMIDERSFNNIHRVEVLKLSHNEIVQIHPQSFKQLHSLTNLWLDYNEITALPPSLFSNSPNIENLYLSNNLLKHIPQESFEGLHNLQFLSLDNNQLSTLPTDALKFTKKLEVLSLTMNRIEFIDDDAFEGLGMLKRLYLRENRIKQIGKHAFDPLMNCIALDLSYNKLSEYPSTVMNLRNLVRLEMNNNEILDLPDRAFTKQLNLTALSINNNLFSSVGRWSFINLKKLRILSILNVSQQLHFPILPKSSQLKEVSITGGNIFSLPMHLCNVNTSLVRLDVSGNQLLNLSGIEDCSKLQSLDASRNRLTSFRFGKARNLTSLKYLDLSHNSIKVIESNAFENMKLEKLNLADNPFTLLPYKGFQSLQYLNLSNTGKLYYLPSRKFFPRLKNLEATYSYHCCKLLYEDVINSSKRHNISCTPQASTLAPCRSNLIKSAYHLIPLCVVVAFSFTMNCLIVVLSVRRNFLLPLVYTAMKKKKEPKYKGVDFYTNDPVLPSRKKNFNNVDVFDMALCHLLLSDFIASMYLAIILVYDFDSRGQFFIVGAWWQESVYCRSAGFFLVLGLQLCFYTLFIATIERYLTTMFPLNPEKQLRKPVLALALSSAWVISIASGVVTLYSAQVHHGNHNVTLPSKNGAMCLPWSTEFPFVAVLVGAHLIASSAMIILCSLMYCRRGKQSWLSSQKHTRRQMTITVAGNLICLLPLAFIGLLTSAIATYPSGLESWISSGKSTIFPSSFNVDLLLNISICLVAIHFLINPVLYAIFNKDFQSEITGLICFVCGSKKSLDKHNRSQSENGKKADTVGDKIACYWQPVNSFSDFQNNVVFFSSPINLLPKEEEVSEQLLNVSFNEAGEKLDQVITDDEMSIHSTRYYSCNVERASIYEGDDEDEEYLQKNEKFVQVFSDFKGDPFLINKPPDIDGCDSLQKPLRDDNRDGVEDRNSGADNNDFNRTFDAGTTESKPFRFNSLQTENKKDLSGEIWQKRSEDKNSSPTTVSQMISHSSESSASKDSGIQLEPELGFAANGSIESNSSVLLSNKNHAPKISSLLHSIRKPVPQSSNTFYGWTPKHVPNEEKQKYETVL